MVLLAEADALTQIGIAIITAVGGIVAGVATTGCPLLVAWVKERRKAEEERRKANDLRQETNNLRQEVSKEKENLADALGREQELQEVLREQEERKLERMFIERQERLTQMQVLEDGKGEVMATVGEVLAKLNKQIDDLTDLVKSVQGRVNDLEERVQTLEKTGPSPPPPGVDPLPPWPPPPPGERKPVWFRGRVYRFVRFGGSNSRIETLNGSPDPLGELKEQGGTTGTIQNFRLFNDRHGLRPITSAEHP